MRATRVAGLLLASLLFMCGAAEASFAAPGLTAGGGLPALSPAAAPASAQTTPGTAAPQQRALELEYLPREDARGGAREIGWLLIGAAIVLALVIVGFVIRHHRTGRAG